MSVDPCEKCKLDPGEAYDKGLSSKCPYELETDEDGYKRDDEGFVCDRVIFKEKTTHGFIATWILQNHALKTMDDTKEIYFYNEGIYHPKAEIMIKKTVQKSFDIQEDKKLVTRTFVNEVIGHILRTTFEDRALFDADSNLLNVENGVLDLNLGVLKEHDPEYLSLKKIPVTFDLLADCPEIKKFLSEICPDPIYRQTLEDFITYCIIPHHRYKAFLIIVGDGDNGKTTYINLIKMFLGEGQTESLSLQSLLENRFMASRTYGKMANLCDDLPEKALKDTGILKILTGSGQITCDVKFKEPITFDPTCKFISAGNKLPKTTDKTRAFMSRAKVIELTQIFIKGDEKTDLNLIDKLTTKEELSGLLNLCLKNIREMKEAKGIRYPHTPGEMTDQWNRFSDPLFEYIESNVISDPENVITKGIMYEDYVRYCLDHKLSFTKHSNVFSRKIKPYIVGLGGSDGYIGKAKAWSGVRFKTTEERDEEESTLDDY